MRQFFFHKDFIPLSIALYYFNKNSSIILILGFLAAFNIFLLVTVLSN